MTICWGEEVMGYIKIRKKGKKDGQINRKTGIRVKEGKRWNENRKEGIKCSLRWSQLVLILSVSACINNSLSVVNCRFNEKCAFRRTS
jgi:hypothetical protein